LGIAHIGVREAAFDAGYWILIKLDFINSLP
jgi:hypothetical protein